MIASLLPQTGNPVVVMRPLPMVDCLELPFTAFSIAAAEKSFYDYFCIVYNCVPRILKEKFPYLPVPIKYHRDIFMICSEAIAEIFWRNDIEVVSSDIVPLPIDFAISPFLEYMGQGKLIDTIQVV
jgi:hypothetical protein